MGGALGPRRGGATPPRCRAPQLDLGSRRGVGVSRPPRPSTGRGLATLPRNVILCAALLTGGRRAMKSIPFAVVFPALLALEPAVARAHAEDVSLTLPVRALKVDGVPAVVLPEQGKLYV